MAGEAAVLCAGLVDGDAEGGKAVQVHQQVVHQIFDVSVVLFSQDGSECHAVLSAQRVVGDEGIAFPVVRTGQVLQTADVESHIQKTDAVLQPFHALSVTFAVQELVDFVLMYDAFQPVDDKTGNPSGFFSGLVAQHFVDVYCENFVFAHDLFVASVRKCARNL